MKNQNLVIRLSCHVLLFAMLLQGCTSYHTYDVESGSEYIAEINEKAEKKTATVKLISGESYSASNLVLRPDSSLWYNADEAIQMSYPNTDISNIAFRDGRKGAWEGLALGAGTGLLLGITVCTLMMLVMPGAGSGYPFDCAAKAGGVFALLAGLIGLPMGASVGHTDVYMIQEMESHE